MLLVFFCVFQLRPYFTCPVRQGLVNTGCGFTMQLITCNKCLFGWRVCSSCQRLHAAAPTADSAAWWTLADAVQDNDPAETVHFFFSWINFLPIWYPLMTCQGKMSIPAGTGKDTGLLKRNRIIPKHYLNLVGQLIGCKSTPLQLPIWLAHIIPTAIKWEDFSYSFSMTSNICSQDCYSFRSLQRQEVLMAAMETQ